MTKPGFKCAIYIIIAALTALATDIAHYQTVEEITALKLFSMITNIILQALIAVRAFMDQSISKEQISNNQEQ